MRPNHLFRLILVLFFVLSLSACFEDESDSDDESGTAITSDSGSIANAGNASQSVATTDDSGRASVVFSIPSGTSKFSVTAESAAPFIRFESVSSDSGDEWVSPNGEEISLASRYARVLSTASVPSREVDPRVPDTATFTAVVNAASGSSQFGAFPSIGTSVTFTVNSKQDSDLNSGTLPVNVFYVNAIAQTPVLKEAVSSALSDMQSIYSSQANVTLGVSEFDLDGPLVLPVPLDGNSLYLTGSSIGPSPAVNIFIGADIAASDGQLLGIAAAIPGPPNPSTKSGVAVSAVAAAGPDGEFSSDELQILGETLAHESGHYIGLFHPVEIDFDSEIVFETDPLTDTEICTTLSECVQNDSLAGNLMFPTPVRLSSGGYVQQNRLTAQQAGVLNRYVVVN